MRKHFLISGTVLASVVLISGVIYYLGVPTSSDAPMETVVAESAKQVESPLGKEGKMETVMTPPRTFTGQFSPEATSMEEFSSNPKRDPAEQQVLDLADERNLTDQAKVQRLLAMIPTLSPDAQTLAMENATALIPDSDYISYRSQLLQLAKSPEMREAVMHDSLTRGEELRLPNLLEMMRTSTSEEEKKEIREIFEAYLEKDYGPNPAHWEVPLRNWIAENTDN